MSDVTAWKNWIQFGPDFNNYSDRYTAEIPGDDLQLLTDARRTLET